jgi:hypothetical protein
MPNLKIVTDSTCNFSKEEIENYDLTILPLKIMVGKDIFREKEDSTYDMISLAYKINSEKLIPKVINPSVDEFFKTYSSIYPRYGNVLSIHMSSRITDIIDRANDTKALLYDASINIVDSLMTEVGLKPLIIKAAHLALVNKPSAHILISNINAYISKMFTLIISDNLNFIRTNTFFKSKKPSVFDRNDQKYRYLFSVSGGNLFFVGRYPMNQIIDAITKVIESIIKGNRFYAKFIYSLDKDFTTTLMEVLKGKLDMEVKGFSEMSMSSMCRFGTHSFCIGFALDDLFDEGSNQDSNNIDL